MSVADRIHALALARGVPCALTGDTLAVGGTRPASVPWSPPSSSNADPLLDFHHALPGRARGDQRELLMASIARDAADSRPEKTYADLRAALGQNPELIPTTDNVQRTVLADVLREHYWVEPERTGTVSRPFAFPFHVALPGNYREAESKKSGQYIMYRSDILLFLSWDGEGIDPAPVTALCDLLTERNDLTMLDKLLVGSAEKLAGPSAVTGIDAGDLLVSNQASKVKRFLEHGAFHQPSHDRFRRDFLEAVEMRLPRQDRVESAILTLSLHLALHYYAISYLLGYGLDAVMAVAGGRPLPEQASFDGQLRFRMATSEMRPVRRSDPCAVSWRELDDRHLISLTPNIVAANLLHRVWRAADPGAPVLADPRSLAEAMAGDEGLAKTIDVAAAALALINAERTGASEERIETLAAMKPGPYALQESLMDAHRRSLHYRSRAVVNQLVRRPFGGSLLRTQGPVQFFELDESFLYLLVKFITKAENQRELPYARFLRGLERYGLKPQNREEEDRLAEVLERLGMLQRYSDAGEAVYVRHLL